MRGSLYNKAYVQRESLPQFHHTVLSLSTVFGVKLNTPAEFSTVADPPFLIRTIPLYLSLIAPPTNEWHLHGIFDILFAMPHNIVASLTVSHFRTTIQARAKYQPISDPDYIFEFNGNLVGIIEVKTFWKVSTESIDEVLQGSPTVRSVCNSRYGCESRLSCWETGY